MTTATQSSNTNALVAALLKQKQETGKMALDAYTGLQAEEKTVFLRTEARAKFCDEHGINLGLLTQKLTVAEAAPVPILASSEANFVVKMATEHPSDGFTIEELLNAAKKNGYDIVAAETKQLFLHTVRKMQESGTLDKADFTRDEKVVYVIKKK